MCNCTIGRDPPMWTLITINGFYPSTKSTVLLFPGFLKFPDTYWRT